MYSSQTTNIGTIWHNPFEVGDPLPSPSQPITHEGCTHTFAFHMYLPPGQTATIHCPICGAPRKVVGQGAIWC